MKRRKWVVFIRESKSQNIDNWVVASTDVFQPQVMFHNSASSRSEGPANWVSTLGRFSVWGEDMAFLSASGDGVWLNTHLEAETSFTGAAPRDLIERDNEATFAHLTRHLDGDSDFAFARRWRTFDDDTRLSVLYGGPLNEFLSLMRSVLLLASSTQTPQKKWMWRMSIDEGQGSKVYEEGRRWAVRELDFLYDWGHLLIQHLSAKAVIPMRTHPCVAQFAATPESCVEVEGQTSPTQHELLEARLYLRDWLEDNAPDRMDLLSPP